MTTTLRSLWSVVLALVLISSFAVAQSPSPSGRVAPVAADTTTTKSTTAAAPAPPASPVPPAPVAPAPVAPAPPVPPASPINGIRNKISAGDLLSAESILEVHRDKHGEDGAYLVGLSWLARGAMLLGENDKARAYAADVRARCDRKRADGDTLEKDRDLQTALGAAIEVEAQRIARSRGTTAAASYVRSEIARLKGPVSLRSRLYKRLNLLTLVGEKAPELTLEDQLTTTPPPLTGQPTLMFLWAEWCGDCRAQAASLAEARRKFEKDGVRVVAVTRYFDPDSLRLREKARVDSVWKADYADLAGVPVVFSAAAMERYGVSSTPTFVFVDRAGIVRRYAPTRLTRPELDRTLTALIR